MKHPISHFIPPTLVPVLATLVLARAFPIQHWTDWADLIVGCVLLLWSMAKWKKLLSRA